jgi:hypothetical protein
MPNKPKWYSQERLMRRWGIDWRELPQLLEEGLPAYYRDGGLLEKVDTDRLDECDFSMLMFKPSDVEAFEQENPWLLEEASEQIEKSLTSSLTAKEKRELGQLRREKKKWDKSLEAAVHVGIYCAGQHNPVLRDQVTDEVYKIDSQLPKTTIDQIWKAIPHEHRKGAGRPKNT